MPNKSSHKIILGTSGVDTLYGDKNGTLTGHGADQTIIGLEGNDHLYGDSSIMTGNAHGGNDTINGGEGDDVIYGDAYEMHQNSVGGNDTLDGASGVNWLYGDALTMDGNAHGGNDTLTTIMFGGSSPTLYGDAQVMEGSAQGGDDNLTATDSNATGTRLYGDADNMSGSAHGGNDTLTANDYPGLSGNFSRLYGDASGMSGNAQGGNDFLKATGRGNDFLWGDAAGYNPSSPGSITGGTDTLNGGGGNDELWGGPNDDKFVFDVGVPAEPTGNDIIHDFNQGNLAVGSTATEHDVIDVHAYGFGGWSTLQQAISDDIVTGNAVVHLSGTDSITLVGVHTVDLHQTDFII